MKKHTLAGVLAISLTLILNTGCEQSKKWETQSLEWQPAKSGIENAYLDIHNDLSSQTKNLLLVKIDPKNFRFGIFQNQDQEEAKAIKEIYTQEQATLAFNGGFFTEDFKPTGLLISKGEELRKESPADLLNGIFAIDKNGTGKLYRQNEIRPKNIDFAIQNGPLILDEAGKIQISKDTGKLASRTAIGLDKQGNIILIIIKQTLFNTDNTVSLYDFAHILKETPALSALNLHSVLNLDGGPSTGLSLEDIYYPEMEKVQNVIIVIKK